MRRAQGSATARNPTLARNPSRPVVIYRCHGAAGRRMGEAVAMGPRPSSARGPKGPGTRTVVQRGETARTSSGIVRAAN
jgi:hypothetical protein